MSLKVQATSYAQADVATFRAKLVALGLDAGLIDSLTSAGYSAEMMKDASARTYAANFERSLDEYGIEGLKLQVLYFLINASRWQGERARFHKKILKKWTNT